MLTYDDIADKDIRERVKDWTGGKVCNIASYSLAACSESQSQSAWV